MSEHLNGKDYGDYFKLLEDRLTGREKSFEGQVKPNNTHTAKIRKKRGIYGVISLKKAVLPLALSAAVIAVLAVFVPKIGKNKNSLSDKITEPQTSNVQVTEEVKPVITYQIDEDTAAIPADNDCGGGIIINTATNKAVAARNPHTRFYPASTTKIMTLLVACENIKNYDDTFTMTLEITDPLYVAEASVAGFLNGEKVTMTDLLYGLILPSGADAAIGLAEKIAGGEAEFVKLMNKKAEELGLTDTHFVNTSGLYDSEHYTTAYDMAVILETALKNPVCKKVLSTYRYTTSKTPQHPDGIELSATLFDYMYGTEPETATVLGGKTGFVNESGYCIASYGQSTETGNEYIVVTLKNSSRWPAIHGQIDLYKQFAK
ncbi:MAG: serine hydrolase [Acutalibacteraceae bacterium]|nr:serine hydrolase [Acutalibacteraceae bacterium]